jgi:ABC-2 type transport system ATP-binding protein
MSLVVDNVSKAFTNVQATNHLSFEVKKGSIFGFLGPNGAGKTTTMRMILDIIRPDSGQITWGGKTVQHISRQAWGYLPEERGLYPKMTIEEQLLFIAQLYGMPKHEVFKQMDYWFERFQIVQNRKKKADELSKGNQQKIQFLAAMLHNPEVMIMDEPFTGLDPVNVNMLKEAFLDMRKEGKTLIFSTHQMETVEELCEDVLIINKGQQLLNGNLRQIKRSQGRQVVRLAIEDDPNLAWLDTMQGITVTKRRADYVEMDLTPPLTSDALLRAVMQRGGHVQRFEIAEPSLTDIFIATVGAEAASQSKDEIDYQKQAAFAVSAR